MSDSDRSRTRMLATALVEERKRAEMNLRAEMEALGLRKAEGWRVVEFTREAQGGTEIVLRPLHLSLASPHSLECIVARVDGDGAFHPRGTLGDDDA